MTVSPLWFDFGHASSNIGSDDRWFVARAHAVFLGGGHVLDPSPTYSDDYPPRASRFRKGGISQNTTVLDAVEDGYWISSDQLSG
jgi:hypothetical protein